MASGAWRPFIGRLSVRTEPPKAAQKGQAIVLIALMLGVVVGMAALAIDGSRAYAMRRDLQAASDSAALAAADNFQRTGSYVSAEQAASTALGVNLRIYGAPGCNYGSPGASPYMVTCNYADGTVLTVVASSLGAGGSQFSLTASRTIDLQFARILTNGAAPKVAAVSTGRVNDQLYAPTLAALSQAGCGGAGGSAISITGTGTLAITGDLVSSGAVTVGGSANVRIAGDIYSRCQSSVPGSVTQLCYPSGANAPCTYPDVVGVTRPGYHFVDPNYPPPPAGGSSQPRPATLVNLSPGTFAVNPSISGGCYFLSAGVYSWLGGYTATGGFVSNELKPPDEPNVFNRTQPATQQFWNTNGVNCAGSFQLNDIGTSAILRGTWGIEVTSIRTDTFGGSSYLRESAPSYCHSITIGAGEGIQVQMSNVPGATSYNVYASPPPNGCSGPFGLAGNFGVSGPTQTNDTSGCPFGGQQGNGHGNGNGNNGDNCSLGGEDATFNATLLGPAFAPNPNAPADTYGAYPPDPETAPIAGSPFNQNPARGAGAAGDRANENNCNFVAGGFASCPNSITPGAVVFYVPAGGCINTTNRSDTFIYGGYQFNWISVYEPGTAYGPANTCSNAIGAASNTAYVGLVYTPAAAITLLSDDLFQVRATGGTIANTISLTGPLPVIITNSAYSPVPFAARLVS